VRPSDRRRPVALVAACALALVLWALPSVASAEAGPAWRIVQTTTPTNLVAGSQVSGGEAPSAAPRLMLFMANVGGATAGTATVVDTLPAGLEASPSVEPVIEMSGGENSRTRKPCAVSGQTVTCEVTKSLPPGGLVQIVVPLAVSPSASGEVVNQVSAFGGGAPAVSSTAAVTISAEPASFGFLPDAGLRVSAFDEAGLPPVAGSHPYDVEVGLEFPSVVGPGGQAPVEGLRSVRLHLPSGLVVNPTAVPVRCTAAEIALSECPPASQVGVVETEIASIGRGPYPLFSMATPPGHPAELAYNYAGDAVIHILGGLDGDFRLSAESVDILSHFPILAVDTFLWGVPSDPGHDPFRRGGGCATGCSAEPSPAPFLTMPSSCTEPVEIKGTATSWLGSEETRSEPLTGFDGEPFEPAGCNQIAFEPSVEAKPTTNLADSPTGLEVNIHQEQDESLTGRGTAPMKDITVALPDGIALNPSAGNGLDACTESEMGYAPEGSKIRFATTPQSCPEASKIGTVEVKTPLLDHPVGGYIYVAKPFANPFSVLLSIYLAVEDEQSGIVAKLAGKVEPNLNTGQLTATFTENPQLPIEDVKTRFFNGPRATLTTPPTCGTHATTATLTPWSTPDGATVQRQDTFATTVSPDGGNCPRSGGEAPNKPAFSAGTISPQAGAYSPFVLKVSRADGSQRIAGVDTTLPPGLTGKLAGIPYCPEAAIAQAMGRTHNGDGALEKQSPSCPAASEVGTADVAAGSGITPLHTGAHIYLAGPYKGAPFSVVVITPAVAGPFDLGVVTTRVALYVDPETARVHAVSDPLPQILDGIPLDVRSIALELDKPGFTLNPTSCNPSAVLGSATSALGSTQALSSPFQVGGCSALPFKPKLAINLKGGTKRGDFPALTATATAKPGEANIGRVSVELPHSAFLEQSHIGTVCTRVQFAQGAIPGEKCPARSIYGKATLVTPLLAQPLAGPVFLRSSSHQLPDLVVALHGQVDVVVAGKVDSVKGALRNTFEAVPDAPFTKFTLQMQGGRKGLIVNSRNLCASANKATVQMDGQNGKAWDTTPVVKAKCSGKGRKGKKSGAKGKKDR
jgi:hypothetical protein